MLSFWASGAATPLSSGSEESSVSGLPVGEPVVWAERCWQTLGEPASLFGLLCFALFCAGGMGCVINVSITWFYKL